MGCPWPVDGMPGLVPSARAYAHYPADCQRPSDPERNNAPDSPGYAPTPDGGVAVQLWISVAGLNERSIVTHYPPYIFYGPYVPMDNTLRWIIRPLRLASGPNWISASQGMDSASGRYGLRVTADARPRCMKCSDQKAFPEFSWEQARRCSGATDAKER
ncbi:uncharacterized protein SCHCODRAFT_02032264 [Schizophyllum commune H4-8]|uniref:uncharacterized protein n=1 Tax=Schizophyllum commune (strain H4-8 / FGSC 9210) TaxID=578458 RepID=UPI00215F523F|nr:uncharacterized protein SCHCODRAFT_02032264 [Schizophyllum commune H4-8]KAI5900239.1 hypothetical protein SCHCODRAFT_02032264 [Schizophyllum commune H4-8]